VAHEETIRLDRAFFQNLHQLGRMHSSGRAQSRSGLSLYEAE